MPGTAHAPDRDGAPTLATRLGPTRGLALLAVGALVLVVATVTLALVHAGGRTVTTPFLSYTAPAGWAPDPAGAGGPLDTPVLTGAVRGPGYDCAGESHVRGFAAAALLPTDASPASGPADRAERLARWFADRSYASGSSVTADGVAPRVTVAPPRPVRVESATGTVDGTVVEVTAEVTGEPAAGGGCAATRGTVVALAAPTAGGAAVLLVARDTGGGPADPAPVDRATIDAVLASVRLGP